MAAHGRDPVHTLLDHAKGWKGDDPGTVDRREGDADAKVGPGEKDRHRLRVGRRIVQFDADLGRLAGQRRVGMDGDLALGVGWVGETMEGHRWAEDFAETADDARSHHTINKGPHVHHRDLVVVQRLQRWRDDHGHPTNFFWIHARQHFGVEVNFPAGQVDVRFQPDVGPHRVGIGEFVQKVAYREFDGVGNSRPQRFGHVQVALAELRPVINVAEDVQLYLNAKVAFEGWHPPGADRLIAVWRDLDLDGAADGLER